MNKLTANILFIGLIVAVILFMIWMVIWLKSETKDCVANPVQYFYEKNPEINCMCMKNGELVEGLSNEEEEFRYNIQP